MARGSMTIHDVTETEFAAWERLSAMLCSGLVAGGAGASEEEKELARVLRHEGVCCPLRNYDAASRTLVLYSHDSIGDVLMLGEMFCMRHRKPASMLVVYEATALPQVRHGHLPVGGHTQWYTLSAQGGELRLIPCDAPSGPALERSYQRYGHSPGER